jgi:hypothetical protein
MQTVWIVKGAPITQEQIDEGCYPQDALGKPEWQFSDGPAGHRTTSADYASLEAGLCEYTGCRFFIEA